MRSYSTPSTRPLKVQVAPLAASGSPATRKSGVLAGCVAVRELVALAHATNSVSVPMPDDSRRALGNTWNPPTADTLEVRGILPIGAQETLFDDALDHEQHDDR